MPLKLRETSPLPPFTWTPASPVDFSPGTPPRPPADFLEPKEMVVFGSMPGMARAIVKCGRCGRPHLEAFAGEHSRICQFVLDGVPLDKKKVKADKAMKSKSDDASKKRRVSEVSEGSPSPVKKKAKLPNGVVIGNHMGLSDKERFKGLRKSEIRKIKKEEERLMKKRAKELEKQELAERKRQRANGPVDYDRQCGVINDKGFPCSRSLTCKTHTVGAKRSVEGRSRPYDELYLDWQREHKPNFKEPTRKEVRIKEKQQRRADGKSNGTFSNGLRKKHGGAGGMGDDDLGIDGVEGQRELQDLIHVTRIAGERVRWTLGWMTGFGQPRLGAGPFGLPGSIPPPPTPFGNGSTVPRPKSSKSNKSASSAGTSSSTSSSSSNRPTSCNAVWRGSSDFNGVGEMITKALAARPLREEKHTATKATLGGAAARLVPMTMAAGGVQPSEQAVRAQGYGVTA